MDEKISIELEQAMKEYEYQVAQKYRLEDEWSHEILLVATARDNIYEISEDRNSKIEDSVMARIDLADNAWKQWAVQYQKELVAAGNKPFIWDLRLNDKPKSQWWWWIDELDLKA